MGCGHYWVCAIAGLSREQISDKFFKLTPAQEGADDVILQKPGSKVETSELSFWRDVL